MISTALETLLREGVETQVFPGAACAVVRIRNGAFERHNAAYGETGLPPWPSAQTSTTTVFDLASLTKAFVTTLLLRANVPLETSIVHAPTNTAWTVETLLSHRSGLAAWAPLYSICPEPVGSADAKRWMVAQARATAGQNPLGQSVYSDLGFIVLGDFVEKRLGAQLDDLLFQHVLLPLGIENRVGYRPNSVSNATDNTTMAPTEYDPWRGRILCGEVHDENCAAMGGISAHAGLFGDALSVSIFAEALLSSAMGIGDFLPKDALLHCATAAHAGSSYGTGFDTKAGGQKAFGTWLGARSFGHLGFTGTSMVIDPDAGLAIVLLTNRVHPTRENIRIRTYRPMFHDRVAELFHVRV